MASQAGRNKDRKKASEREKHSSDSLREKEIELDDVLWSNVRTNLEQYTKQVETIIQCSTTVVSFSLWRRRVKTKSFDIIDIQALWMEILLLCKR